MDTLFKEISSIDDEAICLNTVINSGTQYNNYMKQYNLIKLLQDTTYTLATLSWTQNELDGLIDIINKYKITKFCRIILINYLSDHIKFKHCTPSYLEIVDCMYLTSLNVANHNFNITVLNSHAFKLKYIASCPQLITDSVSKKYNNPIVQYRTTIAQYIAQRDMQLQFSEVKLLYINFTMPNTRAIYNTRYVGHISQLILNDDYVTHMHDFKWLNNTKINVFILYIMVINALETMQLRAIKKPLYILLCFYDAEHISGNVINLSYAQYITNNINIYISGHIIVRTLHSINVYIIQCGCIIDIEYYSIISKLSSEIDFEAIVDKYKCYID